MKTYNVTITATVTKTLTVKAKTEQVAIDKAHEQFSVLNDDTQERYEQETDQVELINAK